MISLEFLTSVIAITFGVWIAARSRQAARSAASCWLFGIFLLLIRAAIGPAEKSAEFLIALAGALPLFGFVAGGPAFARRTEEVLNRLKSVPPVILTLLAPVLFVGGLEAAALGATRAGWVDFVDPQKIMWFRFDYDPETHWVPFAGKQPYNEQRFRGPAAEIPKPAGVFRIMCFGDSNTDGPPRNPGWTDYLRARLTELPPDPAKRYEVINAGVTGYSSHQGLIRFEREAPRYRPDLVLVSFGWNDGVLTPRPDLVSRPKRTFLQIERFLLRFRFYQVLKFYFRLRPAGETPGGGPVPRVSPDESIQNMARFRSTAEKINTRLIFLTRPFSPIESLIEPEKQYLLASAADYNDRLRQFSADSGARLLDPEKFFAGTGIEFWRDKCHFSDLGHRAMADFIYQSLAKEMR